MAGSAGGHNGVKSIISHLASDRFPRLKIGIGGDKQNSMTGHVLGPDTTRHSKYYRVKTSNASVVSKDRCRLKVKPAVVHNVPSKLMRKSKKPPHEKLRNTSMNNSKN